MAARNRGKTGQQLPTPFYPSMEAAGIRWWRSQLALVVGPGSAGKSVLISNLVVGWQVPTLAFLLDQDSATAASRFAATKMDEPFLELKRDLDAPNVRETLSELGFIQTDFKAEGLEDIQLQVDAFVERYGTAPECIIIDNLGNMTSGYENEWSALKAMTLELDIMARKYESLIVCAHHTTDAPTTEPLPRSAILGKISQYPRLIVSVAFNPYTSEYKLCAVKNSSGPTDAMAEKPLTYDANLGNMQITEHVGPRIDGLGDLLAGMRVLSAVKRLEGIG